MSAEAAGAAGEATIDAALRGLRDILAVDGYLLEWFMEQHNHVGIRVVASSEACADCLVPPELMRSILSAELGGTPYRVGSITLPPKS
jgi:hypothetical protein